VVADTGKILDSASSDHHYAVFLKIVAFTWDIGIYFKHIGQSDLGEFAQSGVRLFGSHGSDFDANASLERAAVIDAPVFQSIEGGQQSRGFALLEFGLSWLPD
jgi:hypothetical protein